LTSDRTSNRHPATVSFVTHNDGTLHGGRQNDDREKGMSEKVTGGAAAIAALEAAGVEVVFGIPGVHTLALYDALHDRGIRHVLARHEQGAGFMADGYARATG
jgi:hypothetical protein